MAFLLDKLKEKLAEKAIEVFAPVWGAKDDAEKLASAISRVRAVVEDAEERAVSDKPLSNWLWKLKDAAYDAEDLLEEIHTAEEQRKAMTLSQKVSGFISLSDNPFISGYRIAREIKEMRERMDQIAAEKEKF